MSTFDGIVEEFPNIRIDYFRHQPSKTPPAACFLSHVHSDHLLGLETLKMPFVYCSATTRHLLLKMEKYPHRINFSKGILEARKQTYKHLKTVLRPLPLQSPVDLELGPKSKIRVTLFDANHCPGAVMFLIEDEKKAVLYTGDVRAEPWWVNSIVRSPVLIPYTSGTRKLDCLYLDTTFASRQDIYREFPTKAEGLIELMKSINRFPSSSIFYFRAWTLGYEDVWMMLSNLLKSQVHVDPYQFRLFRAISEGDGGVQSTSSLTGFQVGNQEQPGCLIANRNANARIHSCEPGTTCHAELKRNQNVVWITPIISRLRDGTEIAEVGAGGGKGDLYQQQCEVELVNGAIIESLRGLCHKIATDTSVAAKLERVLCQAQTNNDYRVVLEEFGVDSDTDLSISDFLKLLVKLEDKPETTNKRSSDGKNAIHFPYSRHSSYSELRHLVSAFQPRDICPCTVDLKNWDEQELSMKSLFGDICSSKDFKYDKAILREVQRRHNNLEISTEHDESQPQDTQRTHTPSDNEIQDRTLTFQSAEEQNQQTSSTIKSNKTVGHGQQIIGNSKELVFVSDDGHLNDDGRNPRQRLRDAWRATNNGSDTYYPSTTAEEVSRDTIGSSGDAGYEDASDDLCYIDEEISEESNAIETDEGADRSVTEMVAPVYQQRSHKRRRVAFKAAYKCLVDGDPEAWTSLRLRSTGWEGHSMQEMEL